MSSLLRKLLIAQWFGPLPTWYKHWSSNIGALGAYGYDIRVDLDRVGFNARVEDTLGIKGAIGEDGRKACDYRSAFGVIYADILDNYDYWGHTDLDCVYGRINHFLPDDVLEPLEVFSNHPTYVSGPWALYKNTPRVNETFRLVEDWQGYLTNPATTGWVETVFSDMVMDTLAYRFENWQHQRLDDFSRARWDGDRLMEGNTEVMVAHFRRTKVYPPQLIR